MPVQRRRRFALRCADDFERQVAGKILQEICARLRLSSVD
jgi:hypothetical protein